MLSRREMASPWNTLGSLAWCWVTTLLWGLIRAGSFGYLRACLIQSVMYRIPLTNPPSSLQFNSRIWHWHVFCVSFCYHTHKLRWNSYREMRGKSSFFSSFTIAKRTFSHAKQKNSICPTGKLKVSRPLSQQHIFPFLWCASSLLTCTNLIFPFIIKQSLKTLCFLTFAKTLSLSLAWVLLKTMTSENYWIQSITSLIWISKFTYIC